MKQKKIIWILLISLIVILNSFVSAEGIIVYNSTNFTKPTGLTAPLKVTSSNTTQTLPTRDDYYQNTSIINGTLKPYLMYQLPPGFKIPNTNISIFTNNSNISLNETNKSKSFIQTLNENPPLKYGFIAFAIVVVIVIAYIVYLNYGEGAKESITFGGDFSPSGHI